MDMKLKTAFMSGLLSERINSLIDVLENPKNHSSEEVRDALSKAIDILKAIAGYIESIPVKSEQIDEIPWYLNIFNPTVLKEFQRGMRDATPMAKQEPCEDCISRQAVLEYIEGSEAELGHSSENELVCQDIKEFPPVAPKLKTGHWIKHEHNGIAHIECSECFSWFLSSHLLRNSYCPNCGAKMEIEINTVSSVPVSSTIEYMLQNIRDDKKIPGSVFKEMLDTIFELNSESLVKDADIDKETAITFLYGMRAENLNLDDPYTKDRFDALTLAIKSLEQGTVTDFADKCRECGARNGKVRNKDE